MNVVAFRLGREAVGTALESEQTAGRHEMVVSNTQGRLVAPRWSVALVGRAGRSRWSRKVTTKALVDRARQCVGVGEGVHTKKLCAMNVCGRE